MSAALWALFFATSALACTAPAVILPADRSSSGSGTLSRAG